MKKLLLFAAFFGGAILAGNAKELSFVYQGNALENGASITYTGFTADTYGDTSGYIEYKVDPEIFIVSDESASVNIQVNSNVSVNFCAGGDCITGTSPLKQNVALTADKAQNLQLDYVDEVYDGTDVEIPVIEMTITAWYTNDSANKISMTVKMGGFNTPVESIAANSDSVNVAGKSLHYDLSSASALEVFSLSGKNVMNKALSGAGTVDLGTLPSGVYVYRLAGKAGKFVIR